MLILNKTKQKNKQAKKNQPRNADANEINPRIPRPPISHTCRFGVDFADQQQLITNSESIEEIREFLGVDSLHYLSLEGLLGCMKRPAQRYCTGCWTGQYRLDPRRPHTEPISEPNQFQFFHQDET